MSSFFLFYVLFAVSDSLLSPPLNVTIKEIEVNSAVVTWETPEGDPVIGFAVTQQVRSAMFFFLRIVTFLAER